MRRASARIGAALWGLAAGMAAASASAQDADPFATAFAICTDSALSLNERRAALAAAGWAAADLDAAAPFFAAYSVLRRLTPDASGRFASAYEGSIPTTRNMLEGLAPELRPLSHPGWSGMLETRPAEQGAAADADAAQGGSCLFLSGAALPDPLPEAGIALAPQAADRNTRSTDFATEARQVAEGTDAAGQPWAVVVEQIVILRDAVQQATGVGLPLDTALDVKLVPQ